MKRRLIAVLVCALLAFTSSALAQTSTGQISGTVQDPSGAVVPGAKVVVKNEGTGINYDTTTTTAGSYVVAALPPGQYTVTITAQGFQTFSSTKNTLTIGAVLVINATLKVGSSSEVVQVEASYERLETSSAMLSGVVERKQIVELPLNGRNPLNLIIFEPGLVQRSSGAAGSGTHVFGSRDRAHNVTIDGIDANESSVPNPQSNIHRLTPDNVQEYRVVTHNATPEFGRNSGANVAVATRQGTNEFHGDAYYFHRNTALNSNEFFAKADAQLRGVQPQKPVLLLHQYGGDVGGPIIKNRTFFFFSYQGNRIKQAQPIAQSFGIPASYTQAAKNGLFRYVKGSITFTPTGGSAPITVTQNDRRLVNPSTGNLVAGVPVCVNSATDVNCIATYNMFTSDPAGIGENSLIAALLNSYPLPNSFTSVGDGLNTGGFVWNTPSRFKGPFFQLRGDHKFNDNHNIFARMLWSEYNTTEGDLLNGRPSVFPGFPPLGEVFRTAQNLAVSYRAVLSPQMVNEFTTGYSRFNFFFSLLESNPTSTNPPYGQDCFASSFNGQNVNNAYCNTAHTQRAVSNIQFIDNFSYTRGAHAWKTGFNFRFYRHNDSRGVPGGFSAAPNILFDQSVRSPFGATANTAPGVAAGFPVAPTPINSTDQTRLANAIVQFMGIPARVDQAYQADLAGNVYTSQLFVLGTRIKHFDSYIQDEWKIRRNLTMTYGLRWEWKQPGKDCCNRTFVPDRDVLGSQGPVTFAKADSWWGRDNANAFAPRLSLAWDPWSNGKTVVRAGWGMAFDTISTFQVTAIGGKVPGSVLQCRIQIQGPPPAGCADIADNLRLGAVVGLFTPFTIPVPTTLPSTQFSPPNQPNGTAPSVGAFQPNLRVPTVHEWDLTIQRELPWGLVTQVGYIGKRGIRLYRAYDSNQMFTNQPGFLQSFQIAQNNVLIGCDPDGTVAGSSTAACAAAGAATPTLLLQLATASFLNGSTSVTNLRDSALGTLASRIDSNTGTTAITARGFAANYFRPNAQFSQVFYFDSGGGSSYHGLIVQLNRRFQRGLTFSLAYTLSKSIDDMSVDPVGAASGGGLSTTNSRTPTDVRNFALDRTVSDFDNRHVIASNVLWELPFGKGRQWANNAPGWVDQIIGGWTLTNIYIYQSGEPFTLNSGSFTVHNTHQSTADVRGALIQPAVFDLAGVQGPVVYNLGPRITSGTDPNFNCRNVLTPQGGATSTFFCIPAAGNQGNSGRNSVYGPSFSNTNFGILKNFNVTERIKFEFRTEMFNAFNHASFRNPRNASTGSPTLTSSVFGQTCCIADSVPSSQTIIAVGEPNRIIQFAFKVKF